ncbi:MAG: AraC family transcriptional regulator [Acutalibacteraceae bacterium]|nr:AraC family transcriptional regulator [Acutalibacteraceae bacterium]
MFLIKKNPQITAIHTVFRQHFTPDYKFHGETHNFYELVCVVEGKAVITADRNVFTLEKGQAMVHTPMQFHNIGNIENYDTSIIVFTFSGENIPDLSGRICNIGDISKVKTLHEMVKKYYVRDGMWIKDTVNDSSSHFKFIKEFELFLLRLYEDSTYAKSRNTQGATNYSAIVRAIEENVHNRLSVSQLADILNMSAINLQKTFSKYAGVGVMEYFTRVQMSKATEYLKEGKSVKETALLLNFTDQNYFSTVFKRVTGHSPSDVRK